MKIYDAKKIIPGVVIFLALLSSPVWYGAIAHASSKPPQLTIDTQAKHCIEPAQWMIDHHMQLLNSWRDSVVRENKDIYTASDGEQYIMSLQTCEACHQDRADFCDKCHNYLGVNPSCWNCHNYPEGQTSASK